MVWIMSKPDLWMLGEKTFKIHLGQYVVLIIHLPTLVVRPFVLSSLFFSRCQINLGGLFY